MIRGKIIRVNLEDQDPPELGKIRPAIVLSNTVHNEVLPTVVVVPLSTREPEIWPLRLLLPDLSGLRPSYAVVPGIRQGSRKRIMEELGQVPASFMDALVDAVRVYLED